MPPFGLQRAASARSSRSRACLGWLLAALAALALLGSVPACSGTSSGNPTDSPDDPGLAVPKGAQLARSDLPREEPATLSADDAAAFATGNQAFAFELYAELDRAAGGSGNLFVSPFSISTALAMTYAGAEGETEAEMRDVLHFELDEPGLHQAFNASDRALDGRADEALKDDNGDSAGQGFELSSANQAWGMKGSRFEQPFLDVLAQHYGAGMFLVNFGDAEPTRALINDWVADQTKQRVKDLLPPRSITVDTVFVLTNAIYFKASWLQKFDPAMTTDGTFTSDAATASTPRDVKLMHQMFDAQYSEVDGTQLLELPYLSPEVRMQLILPPEGQPLAELIASLDQPAFSALLDGRSEYTVTLTVPRFSFESERPLKDALKTLGMERAFGAADFSGINGGDEQLLIDEVYHKTFVAVDEQGTEAAAATAVVGVRESAKPSVEISFDRPFVFVIYDQPTGQILFLGHLRDPG